MSLPLSRAMGTAGCSWSLARRNNGVLLLSPQRQGKTVTRKHLSWIVVLWLACLLILAGCGSEGPEGEKLDRLSIAFQSWVGYGPLYPAADKGFFAEEGLELMFVDEELDAARRDAFKAGMLDAEAGTIDLLVSKRAGDTPVVAIAVIDLSLGGDAIVATEGIRSLEDLVGKRVSLARDDVGETFLAYLLHEAGLSLEQLTIVPVSPEKAAQAFLDGKVDAAVTWEPWVSRAAAREGAHVLVSTREKPGIIVDVLTVREQIVRDNPAAVRGLLRGWYRAVEYYKAHPDEGSRVIAPHFGLSPEQYRKEVKGLYWPTCEEALEHFGTAEHPGSLWKLFDTIALIKHRNGRIPRKPDGGRALCPDMLRALCDKGMATR
ncbi:MAG: ABC transporter substrate-binding protein [Candidatus Brocadiae bacterium]|nr:ABC transporter substrate-binding protein [Candidatus Brocadiia bacterium]